MKNKIINGYRLSYNEALDLMHSMQGEELYNLADCLRLHFHKREISTCMIMNAKSGACSEDCKWCSQSKYHKTDALTYKLVDYAEALKEATVAAQANVNMFSLVTSGRKINTDEVKKLSDIFGKLSNTLKNIGLCASLGLLNKTDLQQLYNAGVRRYHCNMETAPSYFPNLCSTHSIEDKIETIKAAREVGMQICSGGIIGMGETAEQRIELAILLQQLQVDSIPVNILQPIKGTPLEKTPPLSDEEILTTFAMFRIINPEADIRFAGGRASIKHIQHKALKCGVSASLVGDMLTTVGSKLDDDFKLFKDMGYSTKN